MLRHAMLVIAAMTSLYPFRPVASQCDPTKGCFPEKFDLLDQVTDFPARTVSVSSTCGENEATGNQYINLKSDDKITYTCNPADVSVSKMVDVETRDGPVTLWQSANMVQVEGETPTPQYVEFRFGDEFLFHELLVKFAVPHGATDDNSAEARPAMWTLEKLTSDGNWTAMQHFAKDCGESFPGVPIASGSPTSTAVQCVEHIPRENGFFDDLNWNEYYPGSMDVTQFRYKNDTAIASYFTTSGIRLVFLQPSLSSPVLASYVSISDVDILVVCKCNGHASVCSGQNQATCECQHFTTGQQCDQCQPLYNNRLPMAGTSNNAQECQACSCNGHASSCQFDDQKNYGVCQACEENTAGDFCDVCAAGFYVNATFSSSGQYCLSCLCDQMGTLTEHLSSCSNSDGQCQCKANVMRRDCSECKDGFYGLAADNVDGCLACACNPFGTLGDENLCDKTDGACLCRTNVEGVTCDTCKPLTYNFDRTNPDGCSLCNCDVGASSDLSCNVDSGQCPCHTNIGGRDCREPSSGFFVPKMDYLRIEPEISGPAENVVLRPGHGTADAQVSGRGFLSLTTSTTFQTTFTPAYGGLMDLVVQYERPATTSFIQTQGTLVLTGSGYECNGQTVPDNMSWDLTSVTTDQITRGFIVVRRVCLQSGSTYTLTMTNAAGQYLIDSILFIPDVSSVIASLGANIDSEEVTRCTAEAMSTLPQNRQSCASIEYSVMAAFLNGALACSCSSGSLTDNFCDPMTGDCNCKDGTLPPQCVLCKTEFYSFSLETGCIACGCNSNGSRNQYCSQTGLCQCLVNVEGDKCDACQVDHFGLYTGQGCQQCQCDVTYSLNNQCDDLGQCQCKPGVGGLLCDACQDGYYNLLSDGCTACQCDPKGSTEESCNPVTGECECRDNVEGHTCNNCKNGFFGLGPWHPGGCIPCFCWEKGINCTFLENYSDKPIESGKSGLNFDGWTAENEDGTDVPISQSATLIDGETIFMLTITPPQEITQSIYYKAPSKFQGDRSASYGRHLSLSMSLSLPPSSDKIPIGVLLEGQYFDRPILFNNEFDSMQSSHSFQISMRESGWMVLTNENTTRPATFQEMMSVLTSVTALKVQALNSNFPQAAFVLKSVILDSAELQGGDINNIENCNCQQGYDGNHCQVCGNGYTRPDPTSNKPSDQCLPCQCNGHTDSPCDPVSGVCTCIHNTQGDHCDVCVLGYYGDATKGTPDDCLPCACPGNVPANEPNVFAQACVLNDKNYPTCVTCQQGHEGDHCELCIDGYFGTPENASNAGGSCQPCVCNGRADTCDRSSGECIGCRENTTGHSCEICAPGFNGDAMADGCQECVCKDLEGSTGECDPSTGVCECLPNVEGFQCEQCVDTFFNLTALVGCEPCNCFETGSTSTICDKSDGQCTCRNLVQGRQCDECEVSYWNINTNIADKGCDECACNTTGTAKEGEATIESCDLVSGQCTCAAPGITGRQCDACSPVTTVEFQYVQLFYLGQFPQCVLCGECFDSWGGVIDTVGAEIDELYFKSAKIWSKYDNQSAETIGTALDLTEENIKTANESVERFGSITQDLQFLAENFSKAIAQNERIDIKTDLLVQRKSSLESSFDLVQAFTEIIQLAAQTTTTLSSLHADMNRLMVEIRDSVQRGNTSWLQIESLSFVVASPEEREKQLLQQAQKSMALATLANTTFALANVLYRTSLRPGVANAERELSYAKEKEEEAVDAYSTILAICADVSKNITDIETALQSLATESETAKDNMLQAVTDLQVHMVNASSNQIKLTSVETATSDFLKATTQAQEVATNAMLSILQNMAALSQAQTDMIRAQAMSNNVLNKQFRSSSDLQAILDVIDQTSVSSADVEALNLKAQKALFEAEESLAETQQALGLAREVKQEVELMEQDIEKAKNLQIQAQGIRAAAVSDTNDIRNIIDRANGHISRTQQDISELTSASQAVQDDIKTVSACLTQVGISAETTTNDANDAETRSQTATSEQQTLLAVMININQETSDQSSTESFTTMTRAKTTIDGVVQDANDVMNITDIQVLLQDLESQNSQISNLETDIDQLTSQVDVLLVALEESVGNNGCSNDV